MPTWFHSYLGLEMAADLIRTYELQFVPGLLQTPGVRARRGPARPADEPLPTDESSAASRCG